jgi:hypothetical protein
MTNTIENQETPELPQDETAEDRQMTVFEFLHEVRKAVQETAEKNGFVFYTRKDFIRDRVIGIALDHTEVVKIDINRVDGE